MKLVLASSTNLRSKPDVKYLTPVIANYIATHGLYLEQQIKPLMSARRYAHTLRVNKLAMELAASINEELMIPAHIAAMCHDIGKEFTDKQLLKLVGKYNHRRFPTIHTLHGLASSIYAHKYLNINVKLILDAIANHVIPSKHPTTLDMILYCADKLEPARTQADVKDRLGYIKLAKHNIKQSFTKLHQETLKHYL
ncbi:hypothetical protein FACS1894166_10890 [Bacilli bacterium]|nr:hypothetical protein FACS1894166_10890 [Bacilli bacterium]